MSTNPVRCINHQSPGQLKLFLEAVEKDIFIDYLLLKLFQSFDFGSFTQLKIYC